MIEKVYILPELLMFDNIDRARFSVTRVYNRCWHSVLLKGYLQVCCSFSFPYFSNLSSLLSVIVLKLDRSKIILCLMNDVHVVLV